jgi:acyl-CoA-binding protein
MSDLTTQFNQAAEAAKNLPERPDNNTLLNLYALYKQATAGDIQGNRPGFTDFAGRAKYDAWAKIKGKSQENAMQEYVDLVKKLQG